MEDSSAASFAALQGTYLGVSGAASVLEHVRRCWASLYNAESVAKCRAPQALGWRWRLGRDRGLG
jgi:Pyruvate phosphate dikinase, AMP/ATP-binding domain